MSRFWNSSFGCTHVCIAWIIYSDQVDGSVKFVTKRRERAGFCWSVSLFSNLYWSVLSALIDWIRVYAYCVHSWVQILGLGGSICVFDQFDQMHLWVSTIRWNAHKTWKTLLLRYRIYSIINGSQISNSWCSCVDPWTKQSSFLVLPKQGCAESTCIRSNVST